MIPRCSAFSIKLSAISCIIAALSTTSCASAIEKCNRGGSGCGLSAARLPGLLNCTLSKARLKYASMAKADREDWDLRGWVQKQICYLLIRLPK